MMTFLSERRFQRMKKRIFVLGSRLDELEQQNIALAGALDKTANPSICPPSDYVFWAKDIAQQALALIDSERK